MRKEETKPKWEFTSRKAWWKGKLQRMLFLERIKVPCKNCEKDERRSGSAYCQNCSNIYNNLQTNVNQTI